MYRLSIVKDEPRYTYIFGLKSYRLLEKGNEKSVQKIVILKENKKIMKKANKMINLRVKETGNLRKKKTDNYPLFQKYYCLFYIGNIKILLNIEM